MVAARVAGNRAAVVIRQAHLERRDSELVQVAAHVRLLFPPGVPLRKHDNGRARMARRKELPMNAIVLRPWRFERARERQYTVMEFVVVGRRRRIPRVAILERVRNKAVEEASRIGLLRIVTDVFEAPRKRQRAPVGFLRPAHVFIAAYFLFKPGHDMEAIEYSVASHANQTRPCGGSEVSSRKSVNTSN